MAPGEASVFVLLLACSPAAIKLSDDSGVAHDSGSSTTSETTTTPSDAGEYVGSMEGIATYGGYQGNGKSTCFGDATLTLSEDGVLTGQMRCDVTDWNFSYAGDVNGSYADGVIEGAWTVDFGYYGIYDLPVTGNVGGGTLSLNSSEDWGGGNTFSGDVTAEN